MDELRVREGIGLDGFHWKVFKAPALGYHIDVMLDPKGFLVGWCRTRNQSKVTEAVAQVDGVAKKDCVNLLQDGQFLGLYGSRLKAADCVAGYVKHTRTK